MCVSGDKELRVKLLKLKLENLVRIGDEKAADQALETFTQVMGLTNTLSIQHVVCTVFFNFSLLLLLFF